MKKSLLTLAVVAALAISQSAHATPITETYTDTAIIWDGWDSQVTNFSPEIGMPKITETVVTMDEHELNKIVFNLSETYLGVYSGDLFLDTNADATWDYVVRSLDFGLNTTAPASLYAINVGLTDFAQYETAQTGRLGHAIGLNDTPDSTSLGEVTYSALGSLSRGPGFVSFDFSGLESPLSFTSDFIIGYTFTCANDVVYQQVPVPEPATFVMLGAGLLGLGLYGRRKKQL